MAAAPETPTTMTMGDNVTSPSDTTVPSAYPRRVYSHVNGKATTHVNGQATTHVNGQVTTHVNGQVTSQPLATNTSTFLAQFPEAAYTTMRMSMRSGQIVALENHMNRLIDSLVAISGPSSPDGRGLRGRVRELVTVAHRDHVSLMECASEAWLKLTVVAQNTSDRVFLVTEPQCANHSDDGGCQVEIHQGLLRGQVAVKNTQWVRARQELESRKLLESNEVLMADGEGRIYEGLSSNFFVVKDAIVYTAPTTRVLPGTMRTLVLRLCEGTLRINVVFEHPRMEDVAAWEGAFLTSTSRLLLPITTILIAGQSRFTIPSSQLVEKIRRALLLHLEEGDDGGGE